MSDAALRRAELGAPGTETHAATLARAGRWREAEALYRRLRDEARERQWALGIALEDLPISETRGPALSARALEARAAYLAAIREVRHLSRARAACERMIPPTPRRRSR